MIEIFNHIFVHIPKLLDYSSKFKNKKINTQVYYRRIISLDYKRILNEVITIYNGLCDKVDEMILMDFEVENEVIDLTDIDRVDSSKDPSVLV